MVQTIARRRRRTSGPALTACLAAAMLPALAGCVERILEVRSDPPGAAVYLNGDEIGSTPLDHPFTFYGTVDVALRAQGHFSYREIKELPTPWYELFPFDLFAELLWPGNIRDVHRVEARLVPSPGPPDEKARREEREKADALRGLLQAGGGA
jgi:hypothetical protein